MRQVVSLHCITFAAENLKQHTHEKHYIDKTLPYNYKPVGHYGGRYIWQIASSDNLTICWKEFENARGKEKEMILKFKDEHNGMLPFANLKL